MNEKEDTSLFFLRGGATSLKDLKFDETQRHEAQCQTGHNAGEEY